MGKKAYLDANVLIAHQTRGHSHFQRAKDLLDELWQNRVQLVISSLTIDEFWYGISFILREQGENKPFSAHGLIFSKVLNNILSWRNIDLVSFQNSASELKKVLELIKKFNLRPRDAFHLRIMQQQRTNKLVTFDTDFQKVQKWGIIEILS